MPHLTCFISDFDPCRPFFLTSSLPAYQWPVLCLSSTQLSGEEESEGGEMGSRGVEAVKRRKAMWLYPKVPGFNPPERWGHSVCFFDGAVYVFGGCCGGMHFSDVLALNLETMSWSSLVTTGQKPGSRDSHSVALAGHKMVVFGGTNGTKKVNDLHILDLRTKEWSKPNCVGTQPSPRESHTATVIGDEKLLIFGGSGEGEANYLNDVFILDLKNMRWSSPAVKGEPPAPRDSHTATAIRNKILVYGGDCGDHYHGEVDVLNMDTMAWSRLEVKGSSPGVRAGHAAVSIGTKAYIIGGVGDKQYYSDVWVLDTMTRSWSQLDIVGQQPQGRFSHAAVVINADIAIYGGCGEDERPLNELIILQSGFEHPNGRYNVSMCKTFGTHWIQEKRKFLRTDHVQSNLVTKNNGLLSHRSTDVDSINPLICDLEDMDAKRRKTTGAKVLEIDLEQEEHSLSLSQHSSPSQSDQEQNIQKLPTSATGSILHAQLVAHMQPYNQTEAVKMIHRNGQETHFLGSNEALRQLKTKQFLRSALPPRQECPTQGAEQKSQLRPLFAPLIGAEVRGTVDGAFDSGYLMTANVNGQLFRGVLFAPVPVVAAPRPAINSQGMACSATVFQHPSAPHAIPIHARPPRQAMACGLPDCSLAMKQVKAVNAQPMKTKNDLQDVVLTLGGPGGSVSQSRQ
ncbi:acyl-CoA-binding domain-containing protein 5-like isoform X2 [Zingiber officinale]|uniref:acyl-CoA-binding domain-containing protein 5-like isoform X2 n=1 Tax=Zingiber officinale TaxID=94328 RepID=UPI001C4C7042|nr:acyl-CoA-binding domain-containing protein 5-like isoform X2 [Zingiber officinale]